jgi:hypothetical protein
MISLRVNSVYTSQKHGLKSGVKVTGVENMYFRIYHTKITSSLLRGIFSALELGIIKFTSEKAFHLEISANSVGDFVGDIWKS